MDGYDKRNVILVQLGYDNYAQYLRSDKWKCIRMRTLSRDEATCVICGKKANTVHHLEYSEENLSGADLTGLYSLCAGCHRQVEITANGKKRSFNAARRFFLAIMPGVPRESWLAKQPTSREKKEFRKAAQRAKQRSSAKMKIHRLLGVLGHDEAIETLKMELTMLGA